MLGFDPVHLPDSLAIHVRRETQFRTDVVTTASGDEQRNAAWAQARHHFTLDSGAVTLAEARQIETFFRARNGRHGGFLLRDWLHPHSGTGDTPAADNVVLQAADATRLVFNVDIAGRRNIRPRADGFVLARNGRRLGASDFTLDRREGRVHLTAAARPDTTLTAGFYFDVAVRFDADRLQIERLSADMVRLAPLALVEINLPRAAL